MDATIRSGSRQLAVEQDAVAQGRQYLTFAATGGSFGIAIASIKEIIEYRAPAEVPMMPGYMRGIITSAKLPAHLIHRKPRRHRIKP